MKQASYQEQTQNLMLKPKMLQSLEMLALPLLQLEAHLKMEMVKNPMLEFKEIDDDEPMEKNEKLENFEDEELQKTIKETEQLSEILDSFNEYYSGNSYKKDSDKMEVFEKVLRSKTNKKEKFIDQLDRLKLSELEYDFAFDLIDSIDEHGFIRKNISIENLSNEYKIPIERAKKIHQKILHFKPAGITARTIEECLLAQVDKENNELTATIIFEHFDDLIHRRYKKIASNLGITLNAVKKVKLKIAKLDPKPGLRIQTNSNEYVMPDLILKKIDNEYEIISNDYFSPKIRLTKNYRKIIKQIKNDKIGVEYLRNKVNSAKFLIKSIYLRGRTLERVMRSIINHQKDFFYNESGFLRPLTYAVIAEDIQVNESTISRVVSNKFAETPFGIMCLKDFFTSKAGNDMKYNAISRSNVETKIRKMIENENKIYPLSDQAITELLQEIGINVSRRVVAKYRKSKGILNSHLRRKR